MFVRVFVCLCVLGLTWGLENKTIAQYLQDSGQFTTLVSALKSTGLYDTLNVASRSHVVQ